MLTRSDSRSGAYRDETGRYHNPPDSPRRGGDKKEWRKFLRRQIWRFIRPHRHDVPGGHALDRDAVLAGIMAAGNADWATWLGHASFLFRLGGVTVLTDPFLSDHATGLPPLGPKRFAGPALRGAELPPVDVLLVSHNHYDHLDAPTIEALAGKDHITVMVPLGLGDFFRTRGYSKVHELDWHQQATVGDITVTALPAVHHSGRGLKDGNQTLWCGFAIKSSQHSVHFAGDTAYGPEYEKLGARYGPFDFGLAPIGAYEPRKLMKAHHINPEEAIQMSRDLGSKTVVAMHWGNIILTAEPWDEPPKRFMTAGRAAGYADENLWVMKVGETRKLF